MTASRSKISGPSDGLQIEAKGPGEVLRRLHTQRYSATWLHGCAAHDRGHADCNRSARVELYRRSGVWIYCDPMGASVRFGRFYGRRPEHGMKPFGMRAMMSLRWTKVFWQLGSTSVLARLHSGGNRGWPLHLVQKNTDFIGRKAAEHERANGCQRTFMRPSRWTAPDAVWWPTSRSG